MMAVALSEGITDERLVEVYSDPYISRIGHDHRAAAPIIHPNVTYLSAFVDSEFAGAFMAIRLSDIDYELHALLKRSAALHSRALGMQCLEWAFSRPILRVTTSIIQGLESARNYCIKLGFRQEGIKRSACVQGGVSKDVYILGMLREDWEMRT